MDRMIEIADPAVGEIAAFYDALAPDYDEMTGFTKRFVQERPFFRLIVENHHIRAAVDAGCGTGFHTLLLSLLGVDVTAVDVSPAMLGRLDLHAREMGVSPRLVQSSFLTLRQALPGTVDGLFSLGNTLAHIRTRDELSSTLSSFSDVVKPGGLLFLQNLNYHRILAAREPVQSVRVTEHATFTRRYDYAGDAVRFSVVKADHASGAPVMHSLPLRPVLHEELLSLVREAGFESVRAHGGISMEPFLPESSRDLVILAIKRA